MPRETGDHPTARRTTGSAAQLPLEHLEAAMSGAGIGWYQRDVESGIVIGSDSCAAIFDLENSRGPWQFEEFTARILREDLAGYLEAIHASEPNPGPAARSVNYRVRRRDGCVRHIEVRYVELAEGEPTNRVGLVLDVTDTRQLESQLRDYGEWLDLAVKSLNLALWDRDIESGRFRSSTNYGTFYGIQDTRREWDFSEFLARVHPDDRSLLLRATQAAIDTDQEYAPQFRVRMADGSYRSIESKGRVQRNANGKAVRLVGVSWDIGAKRQNEERLLSITRLVPGMVYQLRCSPEGYFSIPYSSDGIRAICELDPEDVREDASPVMRRIHRDDAARISQSILDSGDRLAPWHEEYRIVHADGSVHWVEGRANPRRERDGSVLWHGYIADITERKRTDGELLEARTRLTLALSATRMLVWYWEIATDRFTSPQDLGQFLGRDPAPRTMREIEAFVHPDDVERLSRLHREITTEPPRGVVTHDFRLVRSSGETMSVESRGHPEFDADGRLIGFHGVTLDVTEQRSAERERNDLNDRLQQAQKMELIGLMTGGIAHDFNNILASILGFAQLAQRSVAPTPGGKLPGYLAEIEQAGARGAALVSQMLAFSRGESAQRSHQDLVPLVERAINMLRPMFPSSVEFRTDLPTNLPKIPVNPTQIQQIIMNLCINARDAMVDQGTISIALRAVSAGEGRCVSCASAYKGDWMMLSVADTGPGIADVVRSRLFEPFVTTKSAEQGTGMGLAMVHSIVHRNHGHLNLWSTPGAGAEFQILLPVTGVDDTDEVVSDGAGTPIRSVTPRRILVVDDERAIGNYLAERLTVEGHVVTVEADPLQALARVDIDPDQFDLVITDQTMPGLSGTELLARIHRLRPHLPVIVTTGFSRTLDEASASRQGVHALVRKPIDAGALLRAIETAFG